MREEVITSTANRHVKELLQLMRKAKLRKERNVFVAEGLRMYREVPGELIREVYVSERFLQMHKEETGAVPYRILSEEVFSHLSDTKTPQGILCVAERIAYDRARMFRRGGTWLLLEDVRDPGNLGTIIRTAEGAGVTGVFLSAGCADIYSPKVVRSTMGSIFRVPFLTGCDLRETITFLKEKGVTVYAAGLRESLLYDEADYSAGAAFLIGNEGNGLSREALHMADHQIMIPMHGQLESLNAAMAAGILLYEAERQKRAGGRNVSDLGT